MKKFMVILFYLVGSIQAQDIPSFDPQNTRNLLIDSLECVIGSNLKLTDQFANVSKYKISVETYSSWGSSVKFKREIDYTYSFKNSLLIVRINYSHDTDSINYLVVNGDLWDDFGNHYNSTDYWKIKPTYPILTPIIDSVYYCGSKASFNFGALGLDNDTLYSYEVIDNSMNKIADGKGSMVVLDGLMNDESLFRKTITIKGLYTNSTFKYKYSSIDENIYDSEWKTIILGPQPVDLEKDYKWIEESEGSKLCLMFHYKVGNRLYIPDIQFDYRVYNVNSEKDISKRDVELIADKEWAIMKIKNIDRSLPINLTVKFNDQYNEIIKDFSIPASILN
jgi:hypothetical protein